MGSVESFSYGWRVLAVDPRGPCGSHELIPFIEYIVGINGTRLHDRSEEVMRSLAKNNTKQTRLTVFNYKTRTERVLEICPHENWGGAGLLGLIIAMDDFATADRRAVRVLSVTPDSPAALAGLNPLVDYILGTDCFIFYGRNGMFQHLDENMNSELRLRVYNSRISEVREVKITAADQSNVGWELASGQLHRIPDPLPGTIITAASSVSVEISKGCAGILVAQLGEASKDDDGPILMSDMNLTIGEPINSMYGMKKARGDNIIPSNTQATSVEELEECQRLKE